MCNYRIDKYNMFKVMNIVYHIFLISLLIFIITFPYGLSKQYFPYLETIKTVSDKIKKNTLLYYSILSLYYGNIFMYDMIINPFEFIVIVIDVDTLYFMFCIFRSILSIILLISFSFSVTLIMVKIYENMPDN